jgi:hypothetical protein
METILTHVISKESVIPQLPYREFRGANWTPIQIFEGDALTPTFHRQSIFLKNIMESVKKRLG